MSAPISPKSSKKISFSFAPLPSSADGALFAHKQVKVSNPHTYNCDSEDSEVPPLPARVSISNKTMTMMDVGEDEVVDDLHTSNHSNKNNATTMPSPSNKESNAFLQMK